MINVPGLVEDMPDQQYHLDPVPGGSLSSTFARLLTTHVPAKADAIRRNRKATKAMDFGKAAHRTALGAGPDLVVYDYDGRTKDGKAERAAYNAAIKSERAVAVTQEERSRILGMSAALLSSPEVCAILENSRAEVSGFWTEGDTWCRMRVDLLSSNFSHDYKTTSDASRRGFQKSMADFGYHQQAEFYQRGLRALGHAAADVPMRFICQETQPPYLVQIHTPDDEALALAAELNDRAIRIYQAAKDTGYWPGYETVTAEPTSLPAYYYYANEDALPEGWRVLEDDMEIA